jgi:hypothetical protein
MIEYIIGTIALVSVVFLYLRVRLWHCTECGMGNGTDQLLDYGHVASTIEDDPYCPYCGAQTVYWGRRARYWWNQLNAWYNDEETPDKVAWKHE